MTLTKRVPNLPRRTLRQAWSGTASAGLGFGDQLILLAVPMTLFAVFFIVPNLLNFALSLTNWNSYSDNLRFIGFDNFADLLADGTLWNDLRITLTFAVFVSLFQNTIGLALAVGLEKSTRWNGFLRALLFVPVLISPLATGYLFKGLLAYDGPVNGVLSFLSGSQVHIEFLGSTVWTIVVVAAVHSWKFFGLTMLIYIAGLAAIPEDLLEAATLDGASRWQTFWRVKWRMLAPAVTVNFTLTLIGSLNAFDVVLATTNGGPARSTEVFNIFVFQRFGSGTFGLSVAMSLVLFLTVVAVAIPLITYLRRRELEA